MPAEISDELRAFLLEGTRTAKIATVRANGRPHVAPVWFVLDGDTIVFTTWHETMKARNIRLTGQVSLAVDDQTPPYSFAIIDGTAELSDDLRQLEYWATEIARRYMGEELAESYGQRNGVPGELLVRVTPTKIIFATDIAL
jgi:PPOX class probable F420-dependent enzyme